MSGCFARVLFGNEVRDPLLGKSGQPKRHGVVAGTSAASDRELKYAALNVKLWEVADVCDPIISCLSPHGVHSPRSNTERFPLGTWPNDSVQTLNALTKVLFDQRFSSLADLAGALVPAPWAVATSPLVSRRPTSMPEAA